MKENTFTSVVTWAGIDWPDGKGILVGNCVLFGTPFLIAVVDRSRQIACWGDR
ncbi:hypothetical protein K239x_13060 [Planctomycetes bacterium K23_9]|uniref:Uncharacterized protein n=1 Tax=Stieleria marina TaxID=1930275 RepID=A0A517NQG9_9BACT|nr:hypothetical protein K239x_13060 [Planctomycetes bacterium K23_9]